MGGAWTAFAARRELRTAIYKPDRVKCRHCQVRLRCRSKGLCSTCSSTPSIRAMYASEVNRGVEDFCGAPPLAEPTDTIPGTESRIAVYQERAAAGLAVFHPRDAKAVLT